MDEAEEVDVAPVVAGRHATEVFELVEASLDAVAGFVEDGSKTRSQTAVLAQREKRLCTLFGLPYRSGRSCQWAPERSTHKTPFTNRRLSAAVRPGSRALPGRRSAMRSHCASVSSYRFAIPCTPNRLTRSAMNQRLAALRILNVDQT